MAHPTLKPGPGRCFIIPDERHKVRPSGIALPSIAQDDAFHGTVVARGDSPWMGKLDGVAALVYEPQTPEVRKRWRPVFKKAACEVGDVVHYAPEKVLVMPLGMSPEDGTVYILDQRDILGREERSASSA